METHGNLLIIGLMIRTIREHYDLITATKEGRATLGELQPVGDTAEDFVVEVKSGSKTGLWRRAAWVFAVHAWVMDVLFDAHKKEVDEKLSNQIFGTARWYQSLSFAFQFGHELVWDGAKYIYEDTTSAAAIAARIVKYCSVPKVENQLQFKVAKDSGGSPEKLEIAEKDALFAYLNDTGYPGENFVVISEDPDELRLELDIYYDPQIMANDGSLLNDPSVFPVKDAINGYAQSLDWNGKVHQSKMMDQAQLADGVKDYELKIIEIKYGDLDYKPMGRVYTPFAGHMKVNEDDSVINYISIG